jgi:hypothetical protein
MKKLVLGILILVSWSTSLSAETYHSSFGFTANIPGHWLVVSKDEVKDNPDLFNFENEVFKNTDQRMLNQIKSMILSGKIEIYYNQNTADSYFRDNINVFILIDRLPQTVSESKERCSNIPNEFSQAYGKHIKVYNCGIRKVSGLNAFYVEFEGVVDGTRSIQYQIQKSPSVAIAMTATCKNKSLTIIKKEFDDIVSSIKLD